MNNKERERERERDSGEVKFFSEQKERTMGGSPGLVVMGDVRLWVRFLAQCTGCTFLHINLLQKLYQCFLKKTEKTKKRLGLDHFLRKKNGKCGR